MLKQQEALHNLDAEITREIKHHIWKGGFYKLTHSVMSSQINHATDATTYITGVYLDKARDRVRYTKNAEITEEPVLKIQEESIETHLGVLERLENNEYTVLAEVPTQPIEVGMFGKVA
jgi:hypothetical protein